jgi:redox-sensitive bicupin YhaK (pirin superfamily)
MSPGDLGEVLKPFVFLDLFDMEKATFSGFGLHPHSGITTVTHLFEGSVRYEDSTGATGTLGAGGVEWFKAGHGAWHGGGPTDAGRARGFQLWMSLPPPEELGVVENVYLPPAAVARDGPARVLVGAHGAAASPLTFPTSLSYVAVRLRAGESWRYQPAPDQVVGWVAVSTGRLRTPGAVEAGELAIFEQSNGAIDFHADTDADLVVGAASPHAHDLVLGSHSVHSSVASLGAAERRLREIQLQLQNQGRL